MSLRAASKGCTPWSSSSKNRCKCTAFSFNVAPLQEEMGLIAQTRILLHREIIKIPVLDTQAPLSCVCKTRCNSAILLQNENSSCYAFCHPGHSCTNEKKALCKMDLTAELSEDDKDDEDTWVTICDVNVRMYTTVHLHLQRASWMTLS